MQMTCFSFIRKGTLRVLNKLNERKGVKKTRQKLNSTKEKKRPKGKQWSKRYTSGSKGKAVFPFIILTQFSCQQNVYNNVKSSLNLFTLIMQIDPIFEYNKFNILSVSFLLFLIRNDQDGLFSAILRWHMFE